MSRMILFLTMYTYIGKCKSATGIYCLNSHSNISGHKSSMHSDRFYIFYKYLKLKKKKSYKRRYVGQLKSLMIVR